MKLAVASMAVLATLVLAAPAGAQNTAQNTTSSSSSASSDDTQSALAMTIGCIATYDTILAKGAGDKAAKMTEARGMAKEMYAYISNEADDQVEKDIKLADQMLPDILKEQGTTAEDLQSVCDTLFLDSGSSSAAPAKGT